VHAVPGVEGNPAGIKLTAGTMPKPKRIDRERCFGAIVDVQEFFLKPLGKRERPDLVANTAHFARLMSHYNIPIVATLERPVDVKGPIPQEIVRHLGKAKIFEKDYFDLTRERPIAAYLSRLRKKQAIVAGCETDVCILQSCLGLLERGYDVFAVDELLFSSSRNTSAAIARLEAAGVVLVTYKTLYYELIEAVQSATERVGRFAPPPLDLPDTAL